jgi:nucleotide-binding universal stress UspA family protein
MPIKDILVHLDNRTHCEVWLETAVNLAVAHHAHLIGLYAHAHPVIPSFITPEMGVDFLQDNTVMIHEAQESVKALFHERVSDAGIKDWEWRVCHGDIIEGLLSKGRVCDMMVVGQLNRTEGDSAAVGFPDRVILSLGRPVLVVPYAGHYPTVGTRIMIAWDGGRQAARAVNDALPFLKAAKTVNIMIVNPHQHEKFGPVDGEDLRLHLERHGIEATASTAVANGISAGDTLLSRAADMGIDLMVMGAYGHSRWRELVLGGVTRHMLEHMTVPVLMGR